ncbi:MAG: class I SAM-dependent methyltransferase, partial [Actinomycetota bacterium]
MDELLQDQALRKHVETATRTSVRRGLADTEVRFGRRVGWYALVRAMKPGHVVETGTDKGLGSLVIAAALLRNGRGSLTTIDINPQAGYLLAHPYSDVVDRVVGD